MYLYHFSEEPSIDIFHPRASSRVDLPPVVWAIDEEHSVNYLFPRDCPRVIYRRSINMSSEDEERFFHGTNAETIITVESDWMERIIHTRLYKYTFHQDGFVLNDRFAGYYISRETVTPISIDPIDDLMLEIMKRGVELRFTPNLYPIRNAVISSTIDYFSIIRFRNAKQY